MKFPEIPRTAGIWRLREATRTRHPTSLTSGGGVCVRDEARGVCAREETRKDRNTKFAPRNGRGERGGYDLLKGRLLS